MHSSEKNEKKKDSNDTETLNVGENRNEETKLNNSEEEKGKNEKKDLIDQNSQIMTGKKEEHNNVSESKRKNENDIEEEVKEQSNKEEEATPKSAEYNTEENKHKEKGEGTDTEEETLEEEKKDKQQIQEEEIKKQKQNAVSETPRIRLRTRNQISERESNLAGGSNIETRTERELERDEEEKDACAKCKKKVVNKGVHCGICDRWFHYKCEETTEENVDEQYPGKVPYVCTKDRKKIEEEETRLLKIKYEEMLQENNSLQEKYKAMKKKSKEIEKNYSEIKEIHQRTQTNMENIKKELQKTKQERDNTKSEIETLRNLNRIQVQAVPDKENEIRRLTAIIGKEKELTENMKKQIVELQSENKMMKERNRTKTVEIENGVTQLMVTDNAMMKIEIQKLNTEIQQERNAHKGKNKEIEQLKTEITKIKNEQEKFKIAASQEESENNRKLREISTEKENLEKQITSLKHLNIQIEHQLMQNGQEEKREDKNREQNRQQTIQEKEKINRSEQETEKEVKSERKCYACDSKGHLINHCKKRNNIYVVYNEKRMNEREIRNIMEDYGMVKNIKLKDNNNKTYNEALICFETEEIAQRAIIDINQYPGWKAAIYSYRQIGQNSTGRQRQEETNEKMDVRKRTEDKLQQQELAKNKEPIQKEDSTGTNFEGNKEEREIECLACGKKGHKIRECIEQQNIYVVNLNQDVKTQREIQDEMRQYGKIKSIKIRERYGYETNEAMICFTTKREAEKAIIELRKGSEWRAEMYNNRYTQKIERNITGTRENIENDKNKGKIDSQGNNQQQDQINERQEKEQQQQHKNGMQEEIIILKNDINEIKESIKKLLENKQ